MKKYTILKTVAFHATFFQSVAFEVRFKYCCINYRCMQNSLRHVFLRQISFLIKADVTKDD